MKRTLAAWLRDFRATLADTSTPLPTGVWGALAVLLSLTLFLGLRLLAVGAGPDPDSARHTLVVGPGSTSPRALSEATPRGPALAPANPTGSKAKPAAGPEAFATIVESWRRAWVAKDLAAFLAHYARTFGAAGRDYRALAEQKSRVFATAAPIEVEIADLAASVSDAVAIVSFRQTYRAPGYEDHGTKRLYFLAEDGAWRIFNEEWEPLP